MHGAQQGDLGGRHAQAFGVGGEHRVAVEDGAQVSVFHLDGDDAVVGQQPLVDGVGQGEAEDDRAVEVQIVHRCDFDVDREVLASLGLEVAGGGGDEEPVVGEDLLAVQQQRPGFGEVAGRAVGLVADEHVPGRHVEQPVGFGDLSQRVVGREDADRAVGLGDLRGECGRGGDGGQDAAQGRVLGQVRISAEGEVAAGAAFFVPLARGLLEQFQRGHDVHGGARGRHVVHDVEGDEGLPLPHGESTRQRGAPRRNSVTQLSTACCWNGRSEVRNRGNSAIAVLLSGFGGRGPSSRVEGGPAALQCTDARTSLERVTGACGGARSGLGCGGCVVRVIPAGPRAAGLWRMRSWWGV